MALAESTAPDGSLKAPAFSLLDTRNQQLVSLSDYTNSPLLIVFICNHCPYVVHLIDELVACAKTLKTQGIETITISANDSEAYPQDNPSNMTLFAQKHQFCFPYCFDPSQDVAKAYDAVCTPDFYLFNAQHQLYYRGQFDDSRPGQSLPTGNSLLDAAGQLMRNDPPPTHTKPSVGCSIKWRH